MVKMPAKDAQRGNTQDPSKARTEASLEGNRTLEAKRGAFELKLKMEKTHGWMVQAPASCSVWLASRAVSREMAAEQAGASPEVLKGKALSARGESGVRTGRSRLEIFKTGGKKTS